VAPQDSQNCGRNVAKRKQSDADLRQVLRMVTTYGYYWDSNNSAVGRLTLYPAGMHCPAWGDAFGF